MNIRCPHCNKNLPGKHDDRVVAGDYIECGLCGHVWMLRISGHKCGCGRPAVKRWIGSWACARCIEIEQAGYDGYVNPMGLSKLPPSSAALLEVSR